MNNTVKTPADRALGSLGLFAPGDLAVLHRHNSTEKENNTETTIERN